MKRDWIHHGRRPSGLCGAALLIAARIHNFNRTVQDIIQVVRTSESTLHKRLMEFRETPTGNLSLDDFFVVDVEEEQDPPAFTRNLKKEHAREKEQEENSKAPSEETIELQRKIAVALEKKNDHSISFDHLAEVDLESLEPHQAFVAKEVREITAASLGITKTIEELMGIPSANTISLSEPDNDLIIEMTGLSKEDLNGDAPLKEQDDKGDELDLTGIDDKELEEEFLLTVNEVRQKHALWSKINADYLKELEEKEKKKQEEEVNHNEKQVKKRKRQSRQDTSSSENAGEAIQKMLKNKKISKKVDYEILHKLPSSGFGDQLDVPSDPIEDSNSSSSNDKSLSRAQSYYIKKKKEEFTDPTMSHLKDQMNLLRKSFNDKKQAQDQTLSSIKDDHLVTVNSISLEDLECEPVLNVVEDFKFDHIKEAEEDIDECDLEEEEESEVSLQAILNAHRGVEDDGEYAYSYSTAYGDECYDDYEF